MTPWASTRAVLSLVGEASHALAHARSAQDLARALRVPLLQVLEVSYAYLAYARPHADTFVAFPIGEQRADPLLDCGPVAALREGPSCDFWHDHGIERVVPIPTASGIGVWGALLLGPTQRGSAFDPEDKELIATLCDQLGLALENIYAVEQLSQHRSTLLSFFSGIVHEAANPLGALRSSVQTFEAVAGRLCSNEQASESVVSLLGGARVCVETSRQSTERLGSLVRALKEYIDLEESETKLVDLRQVLLDLLPDHRAIPVELRLPEQRALTFACPRKLQRVVGGLMENAAQASLGGPPIVVELDREGERWRLQVRDCGRGMTAEAQASAFEFGFCHKEGRVKLRLGLPYAKHVMEQIGGEARIASCPGRGTTVSLVFPPPDERIQGHACAAV